MKKHIKVYFNAFGYDSGDAGSFVPCEVTEGKAVDIHHIVTREDRIENLMALSRKAHDDYGDKMEYMPYLLKIHKRRLQLANIPFDEKWFEFYILKYEAMNDLNDPEFFKKYPV